LLDDIHAHVVVSALEARVYAARFTALKEPSIPSVSSTLVTPAEPSLECAVCDFEFWAQTFRGGLIGECGHDRELNLMVRKVRRNLDSADGTLRCRVARGDDHENG
jgi:hypothetical protein